MSSAIHRASPAPAENDACGLRSLRTGGRLDISQMVCCARRVVKSAEPILEFGDRSDIGSSTAEERAEEFGRVANVLEGYSDLVSLLGRLLQKPPAPFEGTLVKSLQSLCRRRDWLARSAAIIQRRTKRSARLGAPKKLAS